MKKATIITVSFLVLSTAVLTMSNWKISEPVYMNISEVYRGFGLTKELKMISDSLEQTRKLILDSLLLKVNEIRQRAMSNKNEDEINALENAMLSYKSKRNFFEKDGKQLMRKHNEQIVKQLNSYVSEFGKKHEYELILGATDDGSVMYANEEHNITAEILKYVNQRYEDHIDVGND